MGVFVSAGNRFANKFANKYFGEEKHDAILKGENPR